MTSLIVAGIGPGDEGSITQAALSAIEKADYVWCADRNRIFVPETKARSLTPLSGAMDEMQREMERGHVCAALLSGDTGLYSMLPMLKKRFGEGLLTVLPGISSIQAMCAKLALTWQDAQIISAHGRKLTQAALCHHARTNHKTIVLLDAENDPEWVFGALESGDISDVKLIIGERISYEDESIAEFERRKYDPLSVALIINEHPVSGMPAPGIADEAFVRGKTPMTKREIRSLVINELRLRPDSVVWDVGAGTGSVTVECALQCPLGAVYAVERDGEALELIARNKELFRAGNIEIVSGSAPEALKELPAPTNVFLGGTGRESESIISLIEGLGRPVRLCATAVTLDSAETICRMLEKYSDFTMSQIGVSRVEKVGSYRMFRAQNPVFVMSATIGGE